jgi:hypothetical protein
MVAAAEFGELVARDATPGVPLLRMYLAGNVCKTDLQ